MKNILRFIFVNFICLNLYAQGFKDFSISNDKLIPKSTSEYYSPQSNAGILRPVHVWGEVGQPGLHNLSIDASLADYISAAGGPTSNASLPNVTVYRENQKIKVDLYDQGKLFKLNANDTIEVDRSFKSDLGLVFGGISVAISLTTLILVLRD